MEMMTYPYLLLPEKEMKKRMKELLKKAGMKSGSAEKHITEMADYRRRLYEVIDQKIQRLVEAYEELQAERRGKEEASEKAMEQDEIAEQAMDILNENKES